MSVLGISGGVLRRAAEIARPFGADGTELLTAVPLCSGCAPAGSCPPAVRRGYCRRPTAGAP